MNFVVNDFEGSGQYIVRSKDRAILNTGYLSTILYKVGYIHLREKAIVTKISMSDGLTQTGYYIENEFIEFSDTTLNGAKQKFVDYLNNNPYADTYRFATNEELLRVVNYQRWRTKE